MYKADGQGLLILIVLLIVGGFIWFLLAMVLSGGDVATDLVNEFNGEADKKREEEKRKRIEEMLRIGPSNEEKYDEAFRLYKQGHPMICEIVKRDKKSIAQMMMSTKKRDIRVYRDMYRLGQIFDFVIPQLKLFEKAIPGDPMYKGFMEESKRDLEEWRMKIGVSEIYDDPFETLDPHEPKEELVRRGSDIAKKYGYFENGSPNIFKKK